MRLGNFNKFECTRLSQYLPKIIDFKMRILSLPMFIGLILTIFTSKAFSQEFQVLRYTPAQIEALFLEQNLQLIAENMNIDLADAEIVQARLWDNPELSIGSVNFWSTPKQREEIGMGTFPRNTQFSIELSQLIQTANKRKKLVNREKTAKEIAIQEFEDVLRGLKIELRTLIIEAEYLQSYREVLSGQQKSMEQLISAYRKQTEQRNVAKSELIRLQSGLLELESETNEIQIALNEQQKNLKSLLNLPPFYIIEIDGNRSEVANPDDVLLASLLEKAAEARPDIKRQQLQTQFHEKSLAYEKSQRVPDITLSANYDRYDGLWKDYVGLGVSFSLPFLNRNQGNIKAAKISIEQSRSLDQHQQNIAQHEVAEAFGNYIHAYRFYKKITANEFLAELDNMLDVYIQNLLGGNISMLEYIDFMEAYKSNKQTVLSSRKNMYASFEELQYRVGFGVK